jgi:hypothetical protein
VRTSLPHVDRPLDRIRVAFDSPDISRPRVLRFTRQGAVDPSYGPLGQGYASLADGTRTVRPNAMRVDASGDLVLAGMVQNGPGVDLAPAVAKLQGDRPAPPMESSGGGGGGGCGTIRGPGPFDPVRPSLVLLSFWMLRRRQCTRSSSSSRTSSGTS